MQEIEQKQNELDKLSQSIEQQLPGLSENAYQQRMRELRQKIANHQSDMQESQSKLDGAFRAASQKIQAAIELVVDEITYEQNIVLVLPRSVIVGRPRVPQITHEVLKRLNQRLPSVAVELAD